MPQLLSKPRKEPRYWFWNKDKQQELIDLGSTSDISYAAKLGSADSELVLSKKQLEDAFGVIMNEWS